MAVDLEDNAGWTEAWTESWTDPTDNSSSPAAAKKPMVMVYVQVLLSPLVFLGNVLILVAIRRSRAMKKVTYLFIGHLAVADLLFGVGMCTRFFLIISDNLDKYPCMFAQCFVITAGGAGSTGILFLCLEGYLSVKYFMSFKRVFTPRLAWGLIVGCWVFWISMSLLSIVIAAYSPVKKAVCFLGGGYYESWYLVLVPTVYFCQLLLVIYYQLGTIAITRKHFSHLNPRVQPSAAAKTQNSTQDSGQKRRLNKLSNLSKLVGLVLVLFFVCWTPSMAGLYFFASCKKDCDELAAILLNLASLLVVSSFMNVVIYAIKSPEFRNGFRKVLRPRCNRVGAGESDLSNTATSRPSHTTSRGGDHETPITSSTRVQTIKGTPYTIPVKPSQTLMTASHR